MHDQAFLHDGEHLLVSVRPSKAHLLVEFFKGLIDTFLIGLVVSLLTSAGFWLLAGTLPAIWIYVILWAILFLLVSFRRYRLWAHESLRVTTERILLQKTGSIFSQPLTTIKWTQYQESFLGIRTMFDLLFRARPLCIRYGTADAHQKVCFPSLRYAQDLKHYLDKADSMVRKNQDAELKPFVAKPRGQRD